MHGFIFANTKKWSKKWSKVSYYLVFLFSLNISKHILLWDLLNHALSDSQSPPHTPTHSYSLLPTPTHCYSLTSTHFHLLTPINVQRIFSWHVVKSLHTEKYVVFTSSINNYVLIFSFWKYRNASRVFTVSGKASLLRSGVYNKNSN